MKKERERACALLNELNSESQDDLERVFCDVFQNRKDLLGNEIKSEIGYLEICYLKHRDWLEAKTVETEHKKQKQSEIELLRQAEEEKKLREDEEWKRVEMEFIKTFPNKDEQLSIIASYSHELMGFTATVEPMRRNFAISAWYQDNLLQEQKV